MSVRLAGVFVDQQTGRPIPHARVEVAQLTMRGFLQMQGPPVPLGRTTTDALGRFAFRTVGTLPMEVSCLDIVQRRIGVRDIHRLPAESIVIYGVHLGSPPKVEPPGGRKRPNQAIQRTAR